MNIISLSTVPPRFERLAPVLESLKAQSADIDRIMLFVPHRYRRFPDFDGTPPKLPAGVELHRPDRDYGPATKLLPALRTLHGQDCNILFCDDDHLFQPAWAQTLIDQAAAHPGCAIALSAFDIENTGYTATERTHLPRARYNPKERGPGYRLRRIAQQIDVLHLFTPRHKPARWRVLEPGYADIFEGVGGVLVRPEFFPDDAVFDIPETLWSVDDVWLSGHAALAGVPIWATGASHVPYETRLSVQHPLNKATIAGLDRQQANRACVRYFRDQHGIWR